MAQNLQNFYSTRPFKPSIDTQQKTAQNFAKLEKALNDRNQILLKVQEQARINAGLAYTPTEITAELNTNFANIGASINQKFQDWSIENAAALDKNSKNFNPAALAVHNVYKNDIINTYKNINKAQASYETIIRGYQDGKLEFTEDEYNNFKAQYEDIKSITPDRIGVNDNGNLTLRVTGENGEEEDVLLSGYKGFDFTKALSAPKPIDYTKIVLDNLKYTDTSQDVNKSYEAMLVKTSPRDQLGALTEYLTQKYPEATDHENMAKQPEYQEEFAKFIKDTAVNEATRTRSAGTGSRIRPGEVPKLFNISGFRKPDKQPDGSVLPGDKERAMEVIRQNRQSNYKLYAPQYDEFMRLQGYDTFTPEQLDEEWYNYLMNTQPEADIKYNPNQVAVDPIDINQPVKGVTSVTAFTPFTADKRYAAADKTEATFDPVNREQVTYGGGGAFKTSLQDMGNYSIDIGTVNATSIGIIRKTKKEDSSSKAEYFLKDQFDIQGEGQFTPTELVVGIPSVTSAQVIPGAKRLSDETQRGTIGTAILGKKQFDSIEIPAGAAIDDDIAQQLGLNNVTYNKAFYKGIFNNEQLGQEYEVLIPAEKLNKLVETNTNQDMSTMSNISFYLSNIDEQELSSLAAQNPGLAPAIMEELSNRKSNVNTGQ